MLEELLGFLDSKFEDVEIFFKGSCGYNNTVKYYVRVMASQCVSEELESLSVPEERKLLSRGLPNLLSPRGPRSKGKVARKGGVPFSHNTGEVSAGRISNELKGTRASLKSRKRKNKQKDELGDSEEIIPSRIRFRGQARRARDSSNTGSTERTKLDSATFLHYFMSHWSLLIFCNLGEGLDSENGTPCLLLLDLLHAIGPKRLEPLIRRLLSDIYKIEGRTETREQLKKIPLLIPKVPQRKKGARNVDTLFTCSLLHKLVRRVCS